MFGNVNGGFPVLRFFAVVLWSVWPPPFGWCPTRKCQPRSGFGAVLGGPGRELCHPGPCVASTPRRRGVCGGVESGRSWEGRVQTQSRVQSPPGGCFLNDCCVLPVHLPGAPQPAGTAAY